jgi:regulator of protease activity HflC (stomatin/prohibitin superfamily)
VSDEICQIQPQDPEIQEEWLRETDQASVRAVSAWRVDTIGGWQVRVWVMEYVSEDPLESELRQRTETALRNVAGVTSADEQDRETWFVTGAPSGRALVEAVARVVDDLAERTREFV